MRVLVTNDDGVRAPGIRALAEAAQARGYDVVVAAPLDEASGMSAALTAVTEQGRIVLQRTSVGNVPAFGVAASPAYVSVLAALGAFGPAPEIVLSGINLGANAGRAVLHSGTVGAALAAANTGARAMAVSLDVLNPQHDADLKAQHGADSAGAAIVIPDDAALHWSDAAEFAADLLDQLTAAPPGTVWNLNVPDRPVNAIAGLRAATLAAFGQVQMAVGEAGEDFVRVVLQRSGEHLAGSDITLLAQGYATITALRPVAEAPGATVPAQRQPGAAQPGAAQPCAAQTGAAQPDSAQATAAQPDAAQATAAQPDAAQATAAQPASGPARTSP